MVSEKVTLINPQGLHMRPAGIFATEMQKYKCDITLIHNGTKVNGKSLINIISACIKCGSTIEIICSGNDEAQALNSAIELIESGLGE